VADAVLYLSSYAPMFMFLFQSLPYDGSIYSAHEVPDWAGESEGEAAIPLALADTTDWAKVDDPAGTYYYNQTTGECVWDRPEEFTTPVHASTGVPGHSDWVAAWDDVNQCEYFYNQVPALSVNLQCIAVVHFGWLFRLLESRRTNAPVTCEINRTRVSHKSVYVSRASKSHTTLRKPEQTQSE
jgi:hypothetical protein